MDNMNTIEHFEKYFDIVSKIGEKDSIYKCIRKYNENPYQYFYFDFNNDLNEIDIEDYVKTIISKDYYSKPGSLQWNFYLAFVLNQSLQKKLKLGKKNEIESDENFARKFILAEKDIEKWLNSKYNPKVKIEAKFKRRLSNVWLKILEENNLMWIYNEKKLNIGSSLNKISKGGYVERKSKNKIEFNLINDPLIKKIEHISHIKLIKYRKILNGKNFNFKKINLITGSNGFGKTSLLESIEYFICGSNLRNSKSKQQYEVAVKIKGFGTELKNISDNKILRNRDNKWYGNYSYHAGNKLYESFNKFNFFNTDAAFRLSNLKEKRDEELLNALEEIIIEPDINFLSNKLYKIKERLNTEFKRLDTETQLIKEKIISKIEEKIYIEKQKFDQQGSQEQVIILLKKINWKKSISSDYNMIFSQFYNDLLIAKQNIEEICKKLNWITPLNINNIKNKHHYYKQVLLKHNTIVNKITDSKNKVKVNINEKKQLEDYILKTEILFVYLEKKAMKKLSGINNRINAQKLKINDLITSKKIFSEIDEEKLLTINSFFDDFYTILTNEKTNISNEIKKITIKENKFKSGIDNINILFNNLKNNGLEIIKLTSKTSTCPLCSAVYLNENELRSRIKKSLNDFSKSSALSEFKTKKMKMQNKLNLIENEITQLQKVRKVILILSIEEDNISKTVQQITLKLDKLEFEKSLLYELENIKSNFGKEGLTEEKLTDLLQFLNENHIPLNIKSLTEFKQSLSIKKSNLIEVIKKLNSTIFDEENNKHRLIFTVIQKEKQLIFINEVKRNFEKLDSLLPLIENLTKMIHVDSDSALTVLKSDIQVCIKLTQKLLEEEKKTKKNDFYLNNLDTEITNLENSKNDIKQSSININGAIKVFNDILHNHSKEKYLQTFLDENKNEIFEIFNIIQSPKEFTNIEYNKNKGIRLQRNDKRKVNLQEISTGQRSALAISIFLTLNKQIQDGPEYLIFDDPIAFCDDLNILSFLDYLREYMIKSNRQLFFSTANDNLAFLFKKKFDIFGDDLNVISLERTESS
jgi:energy-coupling factor transporter ATP-binding protein EcfA2